MSDLEQKRQKVANNFFENADLKCKVEDSDGWQRIVGEDEWTKMVYAENEENNSSPTVKLPLVIVFEKNSSKIIDATINGHKVKI